MNFFSFRVSTHSEKAYSVIILYMGKALNRGRANHSMKELKKHFVLC